MIAALSDMGLTTFSTSAMACKFSAALAGRDPGYLSGACAEFLPLLQRLEGKLSLYQENSDVSRINRSAIGASLLVSTETAECLNQAFEASWMLLGKYHPFLGRQAIVSKGQSSQFERYGFTPASIDLNLPVIRFDPGARRVDKLREGPWLDLGGIGKGFALEKLHEGLVDWEIDEGLLSSGGSSWLAMKNPIEGDAWKLKVGCGERVDTLSLRSGHALSSSGDAFQSKHIIDPATGATDYFWKRAYAMGCSASITDAASTAALLLSGEQLQEVADGGMVGFLVYDFQDQPHCIGFDLD